jgi:Reverse transcriptase (RNA-dependent DNA polymerase)
MPMPPSRGGQTELGRWNPPGISRILPEILESNQTFWNRWGTVNYRLDVPWGFNNVQMKEGDEWKAAFCTNCGLFKPLVMFFSLTNGPATFRTMMDSIFEGLISEGKVIVYLDNILVFMETLEEHQEVVKRAVYLLHIHNLFFKLKKCEFEHMEIEYLGVIISHNSVHINPVKVVGVSKWPVPSNKKQVQLFLEQFI